MSNQDPVPPANPAATAPAPANPAPAPSKPEPQEQRLGDILNRDVSWRAIRDLLSYDLTARHSLQSAPHGLPQDKAITDLGDTPAENNKKLGETMVMRGLINEKQLAEAVDVQSRTGQPLWRTLVQLKMAMPQEVLDFFNTPVSQLFSSRPDNEFCKWLIREKVLTPEQLDLCWKQAKGAGIEFSQYLRDQKLATDEQIGQALAAELKVPYDNLATVEDIPPRLTRMIPPSILHRHEALPYRLENGKLLVAFGEAHHIHELERMGLMLEVEVQPVLAPKGRLADLLRAYLPEADTNLAVGEEEDLERLERAGKVMPAVELTTIIVRGCIKSEGTDIHIEPQKDSTRVRYRVDGLLHDVMNLDSGTARKVISRIKSLASMDVSQTFMPQDGHLILDIDGRPRNFRVSSLPTIHGEKIAVRLVQSDMAFSSFEQLGMTHEQRHILNGILNLPAGLVLTCGPVGSGKTTTLYACLNVMDCFVHNITTIEDPVEFDVAGVNQVQVNEKRKMNFGNGLRALLRQDPDVLMVGEIRDEETGAIAVRAAMTGTLVLSTIHANSAATAISSLIYLGVKPYLISQAVAGIIFQRLIRRICPECREEYTPDPAALASIGLPADQPVRLWRGHGCARCFHTGYHGRVGVFEVLRVNEEYRRTILHNPSTEQLRQAALSANMITLESHARQMVLHGVTTIDEVLQIIE